MWSVARVVLRTEPGACKKWREKKKGRRHSSRCPGSPGERKPLPRAWQGTGGPEGADELPQQPHIKPESQHLLACTHTRSTHRRPAFHLPSPSFAASKDIAIARESLSIADRVYSPHSLRFPAIAFTPATHWQKTSDTSQLSVDFYLHNRCRTRLGHSRHDAGLYNGKAGRGLLLYELPQPLAQGGIRETNSR